MGTALEKRGDPCSRWQGWLDEQSDARATAPTLQEWASALSTEDRDHLQGCGECRLAVDGWLSFRNSLRLSRLSISAPPWFAARVMASIAAREEDSRPLAAWTAVPRFASRLAWASAAVLLFAGTWLYQKAPTRRIGPSASITESLFDSPSPSFMEDEVLVSAAEPKQ